MTLKYIGKYSFVASISKEDRVTRYLFSWTNIGSFKSILDLSQYLCCMCHIYLSFFYNKFILKHCKKIVVYIKRYFRKAEISRLHVSCLEDNNRKRKEKKKE